MRRSRSEERPDDAFMVCGMRSSSGKGALSKPVGTTEIIVQHLAHDLHACLLSSPVHLVFMAGAPRAVKCDDCYRQSVLNV